MAVYCRKSQFPAAILLFSAVLGTAVGSVRAEVSVDWRFCAAEVSRTNPDLAGLRAAEAAARSDFKASVLRHLPSANLIYEKDQSEIIFPDSFLNTGPSRIHRHGWRGGLNLFSGFGTVGSNRAALALLRRSGEELRRASAQIRLELREAFGRLLFVQERTKLLEGIAARLDTDVELVDIRFKAGLAPRWSLLSAKAQADEARWRIGESRLAITARRRKLLSLLGRTGAEDLAASGEIGVEGPPEGPPDAGFLDGHPDVAVRDESLRLAKDLVTVAQSGFWPAVNLSALYLWQDAEWPPSIRTWSVGLGVSLPVFSAPRTYFEWDAAKKRVRQEEHRLFSARRLVVDNVTDAYARYRSAYDRLAVAESLLAAEVEREETLRAAFKVGRANFFEWNAAVTRRNQLELSLLDDRLGAYLARAGWTRSLGRGLEEDLR
jgi:outer membrane protein TolC